MIGMSFFRAARTTLLKLLHPQLRLYQLLDGIVGYRVAFCEARQSRIKLNPCSLQLLHLLGLTSSPNRGGPLLQDHTPLNIVELNRLTLVLDCLPLPCQAPRLEAPRQPKISPKCSGSLVSKRMIAVSCAPLNFSSE